MTHRKTPHFFVKNAPKTPLGVKVVKAKSAKSQGCARVYAPTRGNRHWSAPLSSPRAFAFLNYLKIQL